MRFGEYSDLLMEHFEHPRNVGEFAADLKHVSTGSVGSAAQGEVIQLQLLLDEKASIKQARFKAYGSGPTIAVCSLITELLQGKTLTEAKQINAAKLAEILQLPDFRLASAFLVEDALHVALQNVYNNSIK